MLGLRNPEKAALTPKYEQMYFNLTHASDLYSGLVLLLSRTSWSLLNNCLNIKNNVYLSIGRYKIQI